MSEDTLTLMESIPEALQPNEENLAKEEKIVKFVWDRFEEAKLAKWETFLKGHRRCKWWDDLHDGTDIVSIDPMMPNPKENILFEIVEAQAPIMIDQNISFELDANDTSDKQVVDDIAMLQDILEATADDTDIHLEFRKFIRQLLIKGTGILKDWWNPEANNGVGRVETKSAKVEHVFPDPLATDFDDATYVIYAHHADIDSLRKRYPKKRDLIKSHVDKDVESEEYSNDESRKKDRTILVLEMIIFDPIEVELEGMENAPKTHKYPGGRVITVTQNHVLRDEHLKNPFSRFPYSRAHCYDTTKFWGKGDIQLGAALQKELDRINAILLIHYLMSGGWLVIPQDTGIDERSLTNKPNGVLRPRDKNSGDGIRIVERPKVPQALIDRADRIKTAIKKQAGVDEISTELIRDRAQAYSALNLIKEASENRIRGKLENINRAMSQWAWRAIRRIVHCSCGSFKVKKRDGSTREIDIKDLERIKNSDLLNNLKITVNVVPTTAMSRAIRLQQIMELDRSTAILGEANPANFNRRLFIAGIANIPGLTKLIKDEQGAVKKQMEEQAAAQPPPPSGPEAGLPATDLGGMMPSSTGSMPETALGGIPAAESIPLGEGA